MRAPFAQAHVLGVCVGGERGQPEERRRYVVIGLRVTKNAFSRYICVGCGRRVIPAQEIPYEANERSAEYLIPRRLFPS